MFCFRKLHETLEQSGVLLKEDDLLTKLKAEVRVRCRQDAVFNKIQLTNQAKFKEATLNRLIYKVPDNKQVCNKLFEIKVERFSSLTVQCRLYFTYTNI